MAFTFSLGGSGRINLGDYFDTEDLWKKNWEGGNWQKRFGIEGNLLATDTFNQAWGGGKWQDRINPAILTEDSGEYLRSTAKWYNQLGGREFDKAWGGGAWMEERLGGPPTSLSNLVFGSSGETTSGEDDKNGAGGNGAGTIEQAEKLAKGFDLGGEQEERDRLARMRRMLAGRYGRAETNLTGGTGFGSGSQRTLGGYS